MEDATDHRDQVQVDGEPDVEYVLMELPSTLSEEQAALFLEGTVLQLQGMSSDHPVLCDAAGNQKISGEWENSIGTVLLLSVDTQQGITGAGSMGVSYLCQSELRLRLSGPPPEPSPALQEALAYGGMHQPSSLPQQQLRQRQNQQHRQQED